MNRLINWIVLLVTLLPFSVLAQSQTARRFFPVCREKCGYIDQVGRVVIPLQFDEVYDFSEGLARVVMNKKTGFIDETGKIVIEPQFGIAREFSEGLAAVTLQWTEIEKKWGYINKSGTLTIRYQFKNAENFSDGLAAVEVARESGILYKRSKNRFPSLYGYIDKDGNFALDAQYIYGYPFINGKARFWTGAIVGQNKYGLIDKTGKEIIEPKFDNIVSDINEGLAPFRIGNKWGYLDEAGNIAIEPLFDAASGFSEGLGRIAIKNKFNMPLWGFIDRTGKIVIEPKYEDVGGFSEGVSWVRPYSEKFGFIDVAGKLVIKPKFDSAMNFDGGLSRVTTLGKKAADPHGQEYRISNVGYIDKSGKYVWKP